MKNFKTQRFGFVMEPNLRLVVDFLAEQEQISASAVVRRLIWREAQRLGYESSAASGTATKQILEVTRADIT